MQFATCQVFCNKSVVFNILRQNMTIFDVGKRGIVFIFVPLCKNRRFSVGSETLFCKSFFFCGKQIFWALFWPLCWAIKFFEGLFDSSKKHCHFYEQLFEGSKKWIYFVERFLSGFSLLIFFEHSRNHSRYFKNFVQVKGWFSNWSSPVVQYKNVKRQMSQPEAPLEEGLIGILLNISDHRKISAMKSVFKCQLCFSSPLPQPTCSWKWHPDTCQLGNPTVLSC